MTDTAPTAGIDAIVGLSLKVGQLADGLAERDRRERAASQQTIPTDWPLVQVGTYPATGNLALDLGQPPEGTVWLLRRLYIGGQTQQTAVAGVGQAYVSPMPPLAVGVDMPAAQLIDWAETLPAVAYWTGRQVTVHAPERLIVVVTGGTPGSNYLAAGWVESYNERALREVYTL